MSLIRFHWLKFLGAVTALCLAIMYLAGLEKASLAGFFLIGVYASILCIRIQKGTQKARCDLCGQPSTMRVEYNHGFTNVRLIIDCPACGRVVNTATAGVLPGHDKKSV